MSHPITIIDHGNGEILKQYGDRLTLRNFFKDNAYELTKEVFINSLKQAASICPIFSILINSAENIQHKNEMENIYLAFYNIERFLRKMDSEMKENFQKINFNESNTELYF